MPEPLPPVYRRRTPHELLQSLKEATLKTLSTRARSVLRQRDLGICYLAAGRERDALAILDHAHRGITFRGKHDVWYAAASACLVSRHVRRVVLREPVDDGEVQRFLSPPAHAVISQPVLWTAPFVRRHVAGEQSRFQPSFSHPKPEVAIEALAWWSATLIFFLEMADLGYPVQVPDPDVRELETSLSEALARLGATLGPGSARRASGSTPGRDPRGPAEDE